MFVKTKKKQRRGMGIIVKTERKRERDENVCHRISIQLVVRLRVLVALCGGGVDSNLNPPSNLTSLIKVNFLV